jgi:hypothetical protein
MFENKVFDAGNEVKTNPTATVYHNSLAAPEGSFQNGILCRRERTTRSKW